MHRSHPDRRANRLALETSPYLLQHAHNPVDWYPWGPEALERARAEDKPILLSIGYSACHWCHVMAHESFEDEATAALMNEAFVNIKVDREERPDLDRIYQTAHQMLTQRGGGWPLTMFLSPRDQRPFFGGTYFPPEPRYGMPAFRDLLERVAAYYAEHRADVDRQGAALVKVLGEILPAARERRVAALARAARGRAGGAAARLRRAVRRLRRRAQVPAPDEHRVPAARLASHGGRAASPTCSRCTWRRSRSRAWPRAASTTSWAAASAATPSIRTG